MACQAGPSTGNATAPARHPREYVPIARDAKGAAVVAAPKSAFAGIGGGANVDAEGAMAAVAEFADPSRGGIGSTLRTNGVGSFSPVTASTWRGGALAADDEEAGCRDAVADCSASVLASSGPAADWPADSAPAFAPKTKFAAPGTKLGKFTSDRSADKLLSLPCEDAAPAIGSGTLIL